MPTSAIMQFTASPLQPAFPGPEPTWEPFQFGASLTIAKGTVLGIKTSDGKAYAYTTPTFVAQPAAPAIIATGAGGSWVTGTYSVCISYVNPSGETTTSIPTTILVTNPNNIQVPIISGIDATVTSVRLYVNGCFAATLAVAAGATVLTNVAGYGAGIGSFPSGNTAINNVTGLQKAIGLAPVDIITDALGKVSYGTNNPGEFGQVYNDAPIFIQGYFSCADLIGLDANAVANLGRIAIGTIAAGVLSIV